MPLRLNRKSRRHPIAIVMDALAYAFPMLIGACIALSVLRVYACRIEAQRAAEVPETVIAPEPTQEASGGADRDGSAAEGSNGQISHETREWLPIAARVCNRVAEIKGDDLARDWRPVCLAIASRAPAHGVRPSLASAVAWHESRFHFNAIGALGEVGPLQVRPEMHCGGSDCDDRIGAGLRVLARYVGRHGERDGMCRYRGSALGCDSPRVALADRIDGVGR